MENYSMCSGSLLLNRSVSCDFFVCPVEGGWGYPPSGDVMRKKGVDWWRCGLKEEGARFSVLFFQNADYARFPDDCGRGRHDVGTAE